MWLVAGQYETCVFTLTGNRDPRVMGLIGKIDHKTLAVWAADCAELE